MCRLKIAVLLVIFCVGASNALGWGGISVRSWNPIPSNPLPDPVKKAKEGLGHVSRKGQEARRHVTRKGKEAVAHAARKGQEAVDHAGRKGEEGAKHIGRELERGAQHLKELPSYRLAMCFIEKALKYKDSQEEDLRFLGLQGAKDYCQTQKLNPRFHAAKKQLETLKRKEVIKDRSTCLTINWGAHEVTGLIASDPLSKMFLKMDKRLVECACYETFGYAKSEHYKTTVKSKPNRKKHNCEEVPEEFRKASHPYAKAPNGCGAMGIFTKDDPEDVRDTWGPVSFKSSCDEHDRCYYTLGRDPHKCNRRFLMDMIRGCRRGAKYELCNVDIPAPPIFAGCLRIAHDYYVAVDAGVARGVFSKAQDLQRRYEQWYAACKK